MIGNSGKKYYYDKDRLSCMVNVIDGVAFDSYYIHYDAEGNPAFIYASVNGDIREKFAYLRNMQGDIIGLVNESGAVVVRYYYDAWGKLLQTEVSNSAYNDIAEKNPLRYRGYVYDAETGMYYLGGRYYLPDICRFISSDIMGLHQTEITSLLRKNIFAYCDNNPLMREDDDGNCWNVIIGAGVGAVAGLAGQLISDVITSFLSFKITISSIETYIGAIAGGTVGGAILGGTGNMDLSNAATGAATTLVGMSLEKLHKKSDKSWKEIAVNAIVDGAAAFSLGKLPGRKGITKGRNSKFAVYKSGLTKMRNGHARRMSKKVVSKGFQSSVFGGLGLDAHYGLKQRFYDPIRQWLRVGYALT
jgi:RHS repeat-associated protein